MAEVLYDPAARGPRPVGVMTVTIDAGRGRAFPIELWYPAAEAHAGADLDPARRDRYQMLPGFPYAWQAAARDAAPAAGPGAGPPQPLVVFSHGMAGHRRQSTFLCTHLASHGFVVAAPDHAGNTFPDSLPVFARATTAGFGGLKQWVLDSAFERPRDVVAIADALAGSRVASLVGLVDVARLVVVGHSFGGWTALTSAARDARVRAVVALAPAGGRGAFASDPLPDAVELAWTREVPALFVAGAVDSLLPVAVTRELYARTRAPKRFYALDGADHMHFLDDPARAHDMLRLMPVAAFLPGGVPAPFSTLLPARAGQEAIRALALAWLDAHVRRHEAARAWLGGDVIGWLQARGARAA